MQPRFGVGVAQLPWGAVGLAEEPGATTTLVAAGMKFHAREMAGEEEPQQALSPLSAHSQPKVKASRPFYDEKRVTISFRNVSVSHGILWGWQRLMALSAPLCIIRCAERNRVSTPERATRARPIKGAEDASSENCAS